MAVLSREGREGREEFRLDKRVAFEHGYPCRILSIDGTWCCSAILEDISEGGAKLTLFNSADTFDISEFFLVLSSWGSVHRRCTRVWLNGQQIGVEFVRNKSARARARKYQSQ
jgi:hypothetical protein